MAIRVAQDEGLEIVGFSGGVANNHLITRILRERVEGQGLKFIRQRKVPSGDGGISLGQAASASMRVS
jgi:hydrogenase maturation protein HypF